MAETGEQVRVRAGAAQLMEAASTATGLQDFGPGDFRDGLSRFLRAVDEEIQLSEAQSDQVRALVHTRLVNRLEIEAEYRRHPEIEDQVIAGPLSIMGLPRTGTTALCNILSLDERFRCLRVWEQTRSCPPPTRETEADDPRRHAAIANIAAIAKAQPELMAMHLWDADTTEEDLELLGSAFHAQQAILPIFGYHGWWRDCDMRPTFLYHRRVLKLLQSRRPPNFWLLKAPAHTFHLEAIAAAYPDVRFIQTHRDPGKAVPSGISFIAAMVPPGSMSPEQAAGFGRHHAEHLRIGVERAMAARDRIGEDRFLDIHHADMVADMFGTLERVYAWLGRDFTPDARSRMERWHAANRTGAHGAHHYSAEQFGLDADEIREAFAPYMRRFGIVAGR